MTVARGSPARQDREPFLGLVMVTVVCVCVRVCENQTIGSERDIIVLTCRIWIIVAVLETIKKTS